MDDEEKNTPITDKTVEDEPVVATDVDNSDADASVDDSSTNGTGEGNVSELDSDDDSPDDSEPDVTDDGNSDAKNENDTSSDADSVSPDDGDGDLSETHEEGDDGSDTDTETAQDDATSDSGDDRKPSADVPVVFDEQSSAPGGSITNTDESNVDDGNGFVESLKYFFKSWRAIVAIVVILAAALIPFLWLRVAVPYMDKQKVAKEMDYQNSSIIPYKHSWSKVDVDKSKIGNVNVNTNQWLLKNDGEWAKTSCFVFHADGVEPSHKAKVTIALSDSKSRDFFNSQASTLEYGMRRGKISLQVCILLTDDEYSALALEALGEIDFNDSTNTWKALKTLLAVDASGFTSSDDRVSSVMKSVDSLVNPDKKVTISEQSIKNGSFLQWSKVMTDSSKVEKIPAFWIDGDNLSSQDKFHINNPEAMYNKLESLK